MTNTCFRAGRRGGFRLRAGAPLCFALLSAALALRPAGVSAQRDLKNIPDVDPEVERKSFVVAEGFEVNLFAADPHIAKPIHMNFDEQGRLWIASSTVYPQIKPGQKAEDKILVVEDANHDGVADKTTVFADGLLIPTGVAPGDGGAYVAASTELLHLADTDGDGQADRRRVVLSGFGTEDTHHLLHTLRWGFDGCLYMNQSIYIHSHVETPHGVRRLNGGGIWRFRPETLELEVFCRGFVNSWGHHFDEWGASFATDGAYGEGINYVFPGAVFVAAPDSKRRLTGLNPGSPKHCGLEILSGRHLPDDWQGSMVTNDFRAHRVCRFVVTETPTGFASRQQVEVLKSTHGAFRPIDAKMGPDGALYIADWYNPIIQHGEVDFRDPRRDQVHGRIWRVSAKKRETTRAPRYDALPWPELLDLLRAPEEWVRLHAKLALKRRNADEARAALREWIAKFDPAAPRQAQTRLEALWAFQTINRPEPNLLEQLLADGDFRARAAAIRVLADWQTRPELASRNPRALLAAAVADEHPRARIEGARALVKNPSLEHAKLALAALDHPLEPNLDFALWQTLRDLEPHWLPALREGRLRATGAQLAFALRAVDSPAVVAPLAALLADPQLPAEREESLVALLAELGGANELALAARKIVAARAASPERAARMLRQVVEISGRRKTRPAGDLAGLADLFASEHEPLRLAAIEAAGTWRVAGLKAAALEAALLESAEPSAADARLRTAAIGALAAFGDAECRAALARLAGGATPLATRGQALAALASVDAPAAAEHAARWLADAPGGADPGVWLPALLARQEGAEPLRARLADVKMHADVAKLAVRAARRAPQPPLALIEALRAAGGLGESTWKPTPEQFAALVADVATQGDARRGEEVYRRKDLQCLKCHAIGGAGGQVGPDLGSLGASAPVDYIVESLLEPNKKVKENYHSVLVVTEDGAVVTGIPLRKNDKELVLRDAEDRQLTVPTADIAQQRDGRSLMPDGGIDDLTRPELIDLARFLSELGKGDFALGRARAARSYQTLAWTAEAHRKLNRASLDSAAADDPAFTWTPAYAKVNGELPLADLPEFKPHADSDPARFARCQIEAASAGAARLVVNAPEGLSLWVNGKPTPLAADGLITLAAGRNTLVWAIHSNTRQTPLRLELADAPHNATAADFVLGK